MPVAATAEAISPPAQNLAHGSFEAPRVTLRSHRCNHRAGRRRRRQKSQLARLRPYITFKSENMPPIQKNSPAGGSPV
jgi:hypothetical protein